MLHYHQKIDVIYQYLQPLLGSLENSINQTRKREFVSIHYNTFSIHNEDLRGIIFP